MRKIQLLIGKSTKFFKIAITMGATVGISQVIWFFASLVDTALSIYRIIPAVFSMIQKITITIMLSFKLKSRVCKKNYNNKEWLFIDTLNILTLYIPEHNMYKLLHSILYCMYSIAISYIKNTVIEDLWFANVKGSTLRNFVLKVAHFI